SRRSWSRIRSILSSISTRGKPSMAQAFQLAEDLPEEPERPVAELGAALLEMIVGELDKLSGTWKQLSKLQQDRTIESLRGRVRAEIMKADAALRSGEYEARPVDVKKMTVADGIKVELALTVEAGRAVLDRVGRRAMLVICDPEQYLDRIEEIEGEEDQRSLGLEDPTGEDGKGEAPQDGDGDDGEDDEDGDRGDDEPKGEE